MRRSLVTLVIAVAALGVIVATVLFVLDYMEDPSGAACGAPPTTFGQRTATFNHDEMAVRYTCEGATQAGTLYLPSGSGPYPVAVWVHGSGEASRLPFGGVVAMLVDSGVAVFSFDKRGVGESQGHCCPGDNGRFNLLSADVQGAVAALASRSDLRADEIGLIGASQAGWIAAKAAAMSGKVAFIALGSATPVTAKLTNLYERLARGDEGQLSKEEISRRLASAGPSGFDPLPYWRQLSVPSLWMIGTADDRIPVPESIALLNQLKSEGKNIEVVTFPDAGHGLLDTPPTDPNAPANLVNWILKRVHV
jgi:dipeptidyl aminopeptidase/acylaminoacyl peptidase